jgi:hypothetical protein
MSDNNAVSLTKTDWARVDAMSDAEIDMSESPVLTEQFFSRAKPWLAGKVRSQVSVSVDPETLAWLEGQGELAEVPD